MLLTIALIFLWVSVACVADILFKNATGFADIRFLGGLGLYMVTAALALLTYKRIEFGALTILWTALSLLIGLLVSYFYYHETFTATTATAAVLTLIAVILIGVK